MTDPVAFAALQVRVAELEKRERAREAWLLDFKATVLRPSVLRHLDREARRVQTREYRHRLICDLAAHLRPGNPAALIRQFERLFTGEASPPEGAERLVADLLAAYDRGGPSRNTIREALQKFQLS